MCLYLQLFVVFIGIVVYVGIAVFLLFACFPPEV